MYYKKDLRQGDRKLITWATAAGALLLLAGISAKVFLLHQSIDPYFYGSMAFGGILVFLIEKWRIGHRNYLRRKGETEQKSFLPYIAETCIKDGFLLTIFSLLGYAFLRQEHFEGDLMDDPKAIMLIAAQNLWAMLIVTEASIALSHLTKRRLPA